EVGVEECADGPDVLPIAAVDEAEDAVRLNGGGNDVLAEINFAVVERVNERLAAEDVDAHRGEVVVFLGGDSEAGEQGGGDFELAQDFRILRFFDEAGKALFVVRLQDAQPGRVAPFHRQDGDGDVGAGLHVLPQHVAVIHAVKLVAGEDDDVVG